MLVQNICSLRLTDPEIPGFLQFPYVRVNQSASDVGRVGTVLYYNVGGGGGGGARGGTYNRNGGFNFTRLSRVLQTNCTSKWAPSPPSPSPLLGAPEGRIYNPGIIPCLTRSEGKLKRVDWWFVTWTDWVRRGWMTRVVFDSFLHWFW